jgi:hypothetical protein
MAALLCLTLAVSTVPVANPIPDFCNVTAEGVGGCWFVCPQGDGRRLDDIGAVITIIVRDFDNQPIPGVPAGDIWLFGCSSQTVLCGGSRSIDADSATSAEGRTTISGAFAAGGCDDGLMVVVQGIVVPDPDDCGLQLCLPYTTRSPDISGPGGATDLTVDLFDLSAFAAGYLSPPKPYDKCLDFNCDGFVDVIDFSIFAIHYLHLC